MIPSTSQKEVRQFIGLVNYYWNMWERHSHMLAPLTNIMSSKVKYEILYLSRRTFTSAYVRSEPLIHEGRTRYEQEIRQGSDKDK